MSASQLARAQEPALKAIGGLYEDRGGTLRAVTVAASVLILAFAASVAAAHEQTLKPFTVADEIGLAHFDRSFSVAPPILVSPNGKLVAVWIERGVITRDAVEDELRIYDIATLMYFAKRGSGGRAPAPVADLRESTYVEGPIISQIQWLPNSSGVAFLLKNGDGKEQLAVIKIHQTKPRILSLKGQDVTAFAVRSVRRYVYTVLTLGRDINSTEKSGWVASDETGQSLVDLLFSDRASAAFLGSAGGLWLRSVLWAATGGEPRIVMSSESHQPVVIYPKPGSLGLSPDGQTLATEIPVPSVPNAWVREFPSVYPESPYRIRAGEQNLQATYGGTSLVGEYVLIDLRSGDVRSINGAPTGSASGYGAGNGPAWSFNGKALLLPDTYMRAVHGPKLNNEPCVAVFYPVADTIQCIKHLKSIFTKKGRPERGFFFLAAVRFANHSSDKINMRIRYWGTPTSDLTKDVTKLVFVRLRGGQWRIKGGQQPENSPKAGIVSIGQGLNDPPVLMASSPRSRISRVIWNPNPQLKRIALGEASPCSWKDASGRVWTGGLYKPSNYVAGHLYPLVIQTHGFEENEFRPSGWSTTAFAARALAASGVLVLQIPECAVFGNPNEAPCNVDEIEAAVGQLTVQGVIDPGRIGIIGFSATVYHVLAALTTGTRRFAAASVTDGVDYGYWQYLETIDAGRNDIANEAEANIGASPFGVGFSLWLKRSPEFNMQKVHTPLLVVGLGRASVLFMWGPYAALRYLQKPVDLLMLRSDQHVLTNPAARMVSQGGSVDWFRFWLQGYESPHPVMAGEYRRWEKLCDMQIAQNPGRPTWCVPTEGFLAQHPGAVRPAAN